MMRRTRVPAVTVKTGSAWDRLEVLLRSPNVAPVYERKLHPLQGVPWERLGRAQVPVAGEVAMFTVTNSGVLQTW